MINIFNNLYIDTYNNFSEDIINKLPTFLNADIKHVVNLTECNLLRLPYKLVMIRNKIKFTDFFKNNDLIRIKQIPPAERTQEEIKVRKILREDIVRCRSNYILNLSNSKDNILFICNNNNVLSQLFVFIIMTLQGDQKYVPILLKDRCIVTSHKNETDIRNYLDIYIPIIYNKVNEI